MHANDIHWGIELETTLPAADDTPRVLGNIKHDQTFGPRHDVLGPGRADRHQDALLGLDLCQEESERPQLLGPYRRPDDGSPIHRERFS